MSKIEQIEITCIECPIGCHLVVTKDEKGEVTVTEIGRASCRERV